MCFSVDFVINYDFMSYDALSFSLQKISGKIYVILVATGSFNPPTFMHLRMFGELHLEIRFFPFVFVSSSLNLGKLFILLSLIYIYIYIYFCYYFGVY